MTEGLKKVRVAWNKGIPHTEEVKKKISETKKGKPSPMKGGHFSEEARERMSQAKKGKPNGKKGILHSEETKEKLRVASTGRRHSEEAKRKISEASKGNKVWLGRHRSEESKRKISKALKGKYVGENRWNWKDGSTPLVDRIRHSFEYIQWRTSVFTRDNFTCQNCGDNKGGNLEAHHIKRLKDIKEANNIKAIGQALSCDELWDINNGLTLCNDCHKSIHRKKVA